MRLRADQDIPPGQRLLLDYGAYVTYSYLSVDDRTHNNHGLREGDLFAYVRANLDGAQEFFVRTRIGFRDFNRGDNFDAPSNYQSIGFDLDRAYYRLDLQKYNAAYGTNSSAAGQPDGNIDLRGRPRPGLLGQRPGPGRGPRRRHPRPHPRPAGPPDHRRRDARADGGFRHLPPRLLLQHPPRVLRRRCSAARSATSARSSTASSSATTTTYNILIQGPIDHPLQLQQLLHRRRRHRVARRPPPLRHRGRLRGRQHPLQQLQSTSPQGGIVPSRPDPRPDPGLRRRRPPRLRLQRRPPVPPRRRGDRRQRRQRPRQQLHHLQRQQPPHHRPRLQRLRPAQHRPGLLPGGVQPAGPAPRRQHVPAAPDRSSSAGSRSAPTSSSWASSSATPRSTSRPTTHRYLGVEPDVYVNWQVTSDVTVALRYGVFVPASRNFARPRRPAVLLCDGDVRVLGNVVRC